MQNSQKLRLRDVLAIGLILALLISLTATTIAGYQDSSASSGTAHKTPTPKRGANLNSTSKIKPHLGYSTLYTVNSNQAFGSGSGNTGDFLYVVRQINNTKPADGATIVFSPGITDVLSSGQSPNYTINAPVFIDGSTGSGGSITFYGDNTDTLIAYNLDTGTYTNPDNFPSKFQDLIFEPSPPGNSPPTSGLPDPAFTVSQGNNNEFINVQFGDDTNSSPNYQFSEVGPLALSSTGNLIESSTFNNARVCLPLNGSSTVISNTVFQNCGYYDAVVGNATVAGYAHGAAISIGTGINSTQILSNTFTNLSWSAVGVSGPNVGGTQILTNTIQSLNPAVATVGDGFVLVNQANNVHIISNTVNAALNAIALDQSSTDTIQNNILNSTNSGIRIGGNTTNIASNNSVIGNKITVNNSAQCSGGGNSKVDAAGIWLVNDNSNGSSNSPQVQNTTLSANIINAPDAAIVENRSGLLCVDAPGPNQNTIGTFDYYFANGTPSAPQNVSVSGSSGSFTVSGSNSVGAGATVEIFSTPGSTYTATGRNLDGSSYTVNTVTAVTTLITTVTADGSGNFTANVNAASGSYIALTATYSNGATSELSPPIQLIPTTPTTTAATTTAATTTAATTTAATTTAATTTAATTTAATTTAATTTAATTTAATTTAATTTAATTTAATTTVANTTTASTTTATTTTTPTITTPSPTTATTGTPTTTATGTPTFGTQPFLSVTPTLFFTSTTNNYTPMQQFATLTAFNGPISYTSSVSPTLAGLGYIPSFGSINGANGGNQTITVTITVGNRAPGVYSTTVTFQDTANPNDTTQLVINLTVTGSTTTSTVTRTTSTPPPTTTGTPSPTNGGNTPTPTGGSGNTPTPTSGSGNTPTPTSTGGGNGTPTPTSGGGNTPTPTSGGNGTPTPTSGGGNGTPTPTGGSGGTATPTSNGTRTATPTNRTPTATPTRSSGGGGGGSNPTATPTRNSGGGGGGSNPTATPTANSGGGNNGSNNPTPTIGIGVPIPEDTTPIVAIGGTPTPTPVIVGGTPLPSATVTPAFPTLPGPTPTVLLPVTPVANGPLALTISPSSLKVNSGSTMELVIQVTNTTDQTIQNVMFTSSVPAQLRVTSVSPSDSTSVSNNFVIYQGASIAPGATVTIRIEAVAQVSSTSASVVVPGTVTGTLSDGTTTRTDANSPIITIVPAGGLPVTGGSSSVYFTGLALMALAFIGFRFSRRVNRLRRRQ